MSDTLLITLRGHTHAAHMQLHEHPFMTEHVLTGLSPRAYALFLHAFHSPWHHLTPWRDSLPFQGWAMEDAQAIERDVEALGESVSPHNTKLAIHDSREAIGVAYTLLGSSMGGREILQSIQKQWPAAPCSYLSLSHATARWGALAMWLKRQDWQLDHLPTVEGAQRCFEVIRSGFDHALTAITP